MNSSGNPYYTSAQAARIAGFKRPMVDYLCRTGIVVPTGRHKPGRGKSRLYCYGDLVLLRSINRLLESRLPVKKLKAALEKQRKLFKNLTPETAIGRFLITDGAEVIIHDDAGRLVSLTTPGQMVFAFIVDVRDAREHVNTELEKLAS